MLDPKKVFNESTVYKIGDKATFSKTIESTDVYLFAGITGDFNPAHLDEEHGKNSMFKARVAHGMVTAGLISGAITLKMPGSGSVVKKQKVAFKKPVFLGDTVTVNLEILAIDTVEATLLTTCVNQHGETVVEGEVVVSLPECV